MTDSVAGARAMWQVELWWDCYGKRHAGLLTKRAIRHPAKMAVRLTERILDRGAAEGWWRGGDLLVDCFAGVGTTLVVGALRGYRVVGVELEQKYVDAFYGFECVGAFEQPGRCGDETPHGAHYVAGSLEMHVARLQRAGRTLPVLLRGDSRELRTVLDAAAAAQGIITSPAYAESITYQRAGAGSQGNELLRAGLSPAEIKAMRKARDPRVLQARQSAGYSRDRANIGNLPTGSLEQVIGVLTSPAYSETRIGMQSRVGNVGVRQNYGVTAGQLGTMREGDLDAVRAVLGSPLFQDVTVKTNGRQGAGTYGERAEGIERVKTDYENYGTTSGQIGTMASAQTYWEAVAQVYAQVRALLTPNGVFAVVVKDFVRKRQRVELCRQTIELLEALGFEIVLEAHAMMVQEKRRRDLFGAEHVTTRTNKSFYRKLVEAQGAPPIDYEVVIFARMRA